MCKSVNVCVLRWDSAQEERPSSQWSWAAQVSNAENDDYQTKTTDENSKRLLSSRTTGQIVNGRSANFPIVFAGHSLDSRTQNRDPSQAFSCLSDHHVVSIRAIWPVAVPSNHSFESSIVGCLTSRGQTWAEPHPHILPKGMPM
jgi:hypothetical protein